jgi:Holliday junction resolvase RusA-like endonuclease
MSDGLVLFLPCVPPKTSHHAKRIVKIGRFSRLADRPELVEAKDTIDALLLRHQPASPIGGDGPLVLDIELTWPWLKSDSKKARACGRIPHDTKPDWDNAAKTLTDRLAALRFIAQDSRIVDGRVRKWRGDQPGIGIAVRPWVSDGVLVIYPSPRFHELTSVAISRLAQS